MNILSSKYTIIYYNLECFFLFKFLATWVARETDFPRAVSIVAPFDSRIDTNALPRTGDERNNANHI